MYFSPYGGDSSSGNDSFPHTGVTFSGNGKLIYFLTGMILFEVMSVIACGVIHFEAMSVIARLGDFFLHWTIFVR